MCLSNKGKILSFQTPPFFYTSGRASESSFPIPSSNQLALSPGPFPAFNVARLKAGGPGTRSHMSGLERVEKT